MAVTHFVALRSSKVLAASAFAALIAVAFPGIGAARTVSPEPAELQIVRDVGTGKALSEYWSAEPAEHRATAEAVLGSVGASYLSRGTISGSVLADFLVLFGGGGGAPQDLVKLRPESAPIQQETVVK